MVVLCIVGLKATNDPLKWCKESSKGLLDWVMKNLEGEIMDEKMYVECCGVSEPLDEPPVISYEILVNKFIVQLQVNDSNSKKRFSVLRPQDLNDLITIAQKSGLTTQEMESTLYNQTIQVAERLFKEHLPPSTTTVQVRFESQGNFRIF